jgi:uncharacterized protein (DUF2126 family)
LTVDNIQLELRLGIEPWHVLGEELSNTGTARFVDSSLERLQVKLSGFVENRHILVCNGCRVPLRNTGTKGEYVAGIRYKAWNPPSALHPTVGVDAPLVLDIVDTWNDKVIAESRRISRFWDFGHTPNANEMPAAPVQVASNVTRFVAENKKDLKIDAPVELINPEYPNTLDLRKFWKVKNS